MYQKLFNCCKSYFYKLDKKIIPFLIIVIIMTGILLLPLINRDSEAYNKPYKELENNIHNDYSIKTEVERLILKRNTNNVYTEKLKTLEYTTSTNRKVCIMFFCELFTSSGGSGGIASFPPIFMGWYYPGTGLPSTWAYSIITDRECNVTGTQTGIAVGILPFTRTSQTFHGLCVAVFVFGPPSMPKPENTRPYPSEQGVSITPTFEWSHDYYSTAYYTLELKYVEDGYARIIEFDAGTNRFYHVQEEEKLLWNTLYDWRVIATSTDGNKQIGEWTDFTTEKSPNNPNEPSSPNPPDRASDIDIHTDLCWKGGDQDDGLVYYEIYFGEIQDNLQKLPITQEISAVPGSQTYICYPLERERGEPLYPGQTYFWRIKATDESGNTISSIRWDFTTKS